MIFTLDRESESIGAVSYESCSTTHVVRAGAIDDPDTAVALCNAMSLSIVFVIVCHVEKLTK